MRQGLLLAFAGFLLLATLFMPAVLFAQSVPLAKTQTSTISFQASSVPHIVVDGNLSDWAGVYPIINGSNRILDCYLLVEQGQLYFVFQKITGSDVWQIFFDTELSNKTGYQVSGMMANYKLEMQASPTPTLSEWNGIAFDGISVPNGSLALAYGIGGESGSEEWFEGMINLSVFNNPAVFGLVFDLPYSNSVAPETGYIVVAESPSLSLAASFTGPSTPNYGQPLDMTFNLLNFGPINLIDAELKINLPQQLVLPPDQTGWQGTVPTGGRLTLGLQAESLDYGYATSYSNLTWVDASSGENRTVSVPYAMEILPNVSIGVDAPGNMTVGVESSINISVTNMDPLAEPLTIGGDRGFLVNGLSVLLSPNSTIKLLQVPVMPTVQGGYELDAFAVYNETDVAEAYSFVLVSAPRVFIYSMNISIEGPSGFPIQVGTPTSISAVIENEENVSYPISFGLNLGPSLQFVNGPDVNMTLPPNSNSTIALAIKANATGYSWVTVYLNGNYGQLEYPQYFNIYLESAPNNSWILIAAIVIIILILAAALTLRLKRSKPQENKKEKQIYSITNQQWRPQNETESASRWTLFSRDKGKGKNRSLSLWAVEKETLP